MKLILSVIFLSYALAGPVKPVRRFVEEENDPDFKRFMYVEKEGGRLEWVDLREGESNITRAVQKTRFTYELYTQSNKNDPYTITDGDVGQLVGSPFDPKKLSLFISHGWNNNGQSLVNVLIREATLNLYDINVFVVDWGYYANSLYVTSKSHASTVGQMVGEFINGIQDGYDLGGEDFMLVGHSLGAHVAGCAGAIIKKQVHYIVGMDPASPLYTLWNTDNRIDPSDAKFVQIIHTNGLLLGFASSIGHADYFPNGGMTQPGCGVDLAGTCSHSKSYKYFAESIARGPVFDALLCHSYSDYKKDRCLDNQLSFMGELKIDDRADGDYYLKTDSSEPFGLS